MTDQSKTCNLATLPDSDNATFSPGSEAGLSPSRSRDGQKIKKSGQHPYPVSPLVPPDIEPLQKTLDIFGQTSANWLTSADLQYVLGNRLRAGLGSNGSEQYSMTWRKKVLPSGRQICHLRALELITVASGIIGAPYPTPLSAEGSSFRRSIKISPSYLRDRRQNKKITIRLKREGWHWLDIPGLIGLMMGYPLCFTAVLLPNTETQSCPNSPPYSSPKQ